MWVGVGCPMWRCHRAPPFWGIIVGDGVGARLDLTRGLGEEALRVYKVRGAQGRRCEDHRP